jgi:hypothetical protein
MSPLLGLAIINFYRLYHILSINRPTKRGKEKSPSDGHCQCPKRGWTIIYWRVNIFWQRATQWPALLMSIIFEHERHWWHFILWNVWLLSLLFYSVSGNANLWAHLHTSVDAILRRTRWGNNNLLNKHLWQCHLVQTKLSSVEIRCQCRKLC